MTLEINKINILIGPQASGKSVTAKLIYFFKKIPSAILAYFEIRGLEPELDKILLERFLDYFPRDTWPESSFSILFKSEKGEILVDWNPSNKLPSIEFSQIYTQLIDDKRKEFDELTRVNGPLEARNLTDQMNLYNRFYNSFSEGIGRVSGFSQFFIPAGRSFFSHVQASIFTLLNNKQSIDPFLLEFGSLYENLKQVGINQDELIHEVEVLLNKVLRGAYVRKDNKDWIYHEDGRKVVLSKASSGQQEAVPLLFFLSYLPMLSFTSGGASLFIEEPEAHLFPSAQSRIVQLLARVTNNEKADFQLFITTHSPYILSSFNNLMEAGKIAQEQPDKKKQIEQVVPKEEWLNPANVNASSIFAGKLTSLIDEETQLISQNHLDSVSDDLAIDFGKLLDIEY